MPKSLFFGSEESGFGLLFIKKLVCFWSVFFKILVRFNNWGHWRPFSTISETWSRVSTDLPECCHISSSFQESFRLFCHILVRFERRTSERESEMLHSDYICIMTSKIPFFNLIALIWSYVQILLSNLG